MDAESPKFLVSTSVLDAADFTAAFLLTSCGKDALILVDATDERTSDPALDSYDHRFAVPIPGRFSKSPDGLVRQEVVAIDALLS